MTYVSFRKQDMKISLHGSFIPGQWNWNINTKNKHQHDPEMKQAGKAILNGNQITLLNINSPSPDVGILDD